MAFTSTKGIIAPDELSVGKGKLLIAGYPGITFTSIKGISSELEEETLADGSSVSGGRTKAADFTITVPAHHYADVAMLEKWKSKATDPIQDDYKQSVTLLFFSKTGTKFKGWNIKGCWVSRENLPEADLSKPAAMAEIEFNIRFDGDIEPVV